MRRETYLGVVFVLLLALPASAGDTVDDPMTEEDRALFAWFDGLGYPPIVKRSYVRVSQGVTCVVQGRPPENSYLRGFLLEDEGARFKVLTTDLVVRTFDRSPPGTPEHDRIDCERLRTDDLAREWLQGRASPVEIAAFPPMEVASARTRLFLFARALHTDNPRWHRLTRDVLEHIRTLRLYGDRPDDGKTLRDRVAEDLAVLEMRRTIEAMIGFAGWQEEAPADRPGFLEAFRRFLVRYPESEEAPQARRYAEVLERMVRADAERTTDRPLEELSTEERIDELIFRFRDQSGEGSYASGGEPPIVSGPAVELEKLGAPAVPRLIETLSDDRLTRWGGSSFRAGGRAWVHTYADVALHVLTRIAGRGFAATGDVPEGKPPALASRPAVLEWWAGYRIDGGIAALERLVAAGGWGALDCAGRLAKLDPDRAHRALRSGITATSDVYQRRRLLGIAASLPGEGPLDLLTSVLRDGPTTSDRVAAAGHLIVRGHGKPLEALAAIWEEGRDKSTGLTETNEVLDLLARHGDASAIRLLGADLATRPEDVRAAVVVTLARHLGVSWTADGPAWPRWASTPPRWPGGDERDDAALSAREVLLGALEDRTLLPTAVLRDSLGERGVHVRVRDLAAAALARLHPEAEFRPFAPLCERDRLVAELFNPLRRERGLPGIGVRARRRVEPPPLEAVSAALDSLRSVPLRVPDLEAATAGIVALGPEAIPILRSILKEDPLPVHLRKRLDRAIAETAFTVREVLVEPPGTELPAPLAACAHALLGKPVTGTLLQELLNVAATEIPRSLPGLSLLAERPGGDRGVTLTLSVLGPRPDHGSRRAGWCFHGACLRGSEVIWLPNASWAISRRLVARNMASTMDRALSAGPDVRVSIHAVLRRGHWPPD